MIEDNYSRLTYIRDVQPPRYDFIPESQKRVLPKRPQNSLRDQGHHSYRKKSQKKGGFFMAVVITLLIGSGVGAKQVADTHAMAQEKEAIAQKANVLSATLASSEQGSDDAPVLASEDTKKIEVKHYSLIDSSLLPNVDSDAYLIGDVESGEIIFEKNGNTQYPIASVTKLMTALVARENLDLHKSMTVTKNALAAYGTTGELNAGESIVLTDLMYPLLIESSNDAAEVFAEALPEGKFIDLMNKQSWELGMEKTSFQDPSGLTPYNISTPQDLFKLGAYIYNNEKDIYDMTRVKQYSIYKHNWVNHSHFLGYDNFVGGKNGYTDEARRTAVSLFEMPISTDETRVMAIVILKTESREKDMKAMLDYIKKNVAYSN